MAVVLQQVDIDFQPWKKGEVRKTDTFRILALVAEAVTDGVIVISELKGAVARACCRGNINEAGFAENAGLRITKRAGKCKQAEESNSF